MANNIFTKVLLLLAVAHSGLGLKCYICNSAYEEDCRQSPPPQVYLQECPKENVEDLIEKPHAGPAGFSQLQQGSIPVPAESLSSSNDSMAAATKQHANPEVQDEVKSHQRRSVDKSNSTAQKPLADPLPSAAIFCRKTTYAIPAQHNGNMTRPAGVRIVRSCGTLPDEVKFHGTKSNTTCREIGKEAVKTLACSCIGDGCNSSSSLTSLTLQTIFLIGVMTTGYIFVL